MTDNHDGTYTGTVTSTTTAGNRTITATDGGISGQATLTQTPGPATHATLSLQPASIIGNGLSESTATLTVVDAHHNGVPGEGIVFTSTDGDGNPSGELIGQVTDNGDGTYTALIRSSTALGSFTIKGTDTRANIAGQATLTQTVGPATHVSVSLQPGSIVANGTSTTTATASVTDARGNPITGDHLSFSSSDAGVHVGSVTDNGDGTYTATLTSSTTAGTPTITATDSSAGVSGQTTLTRSRGTGGTRCALVEPEHDRRERDLRPRQRRLRSPMRTATGSPERPSRSHRPTRAIIWPCRWSGTATGPTPLTLTSSTTGDLDDHGVRRSPIRPADVDADLQPEHDRSGRIAVARGVQPAGDAAGGRRADRQALRTAQSRSSAQALRSPDARTSRLRRPPEPPRARRRSAHRSAPRSSARPSCRMHCRPSMARPARRA